MLLMSNGGVAGRAVGADGLAGIVCERWIGARRRRFVTLGGSSGRGEMLGSRRGGPGSWFGLMGEEERREIMEVVDGGSEVFRG